MRNQAFRYELSPTEAQRHLLEKHAGATRKVWNWALSKRIEALQTREFGEKIITYEELVKEVAKLKHTEWPWLKEISAVAVQQKLRDLSTAFKDYFIGQKLGRVVGFPKPKKKFKSKDSFRLYTIDYHKVFESHIILPKIGRVRLKESTSKLRGKIKHATISRQVDRWFVSLCVEVDVLPPELVEGPVVGIDMGIKTFAVVSSAEREYELIESPKALKKNLKKIKKLQRAFWKKKLGSKNRIKAKQKLGRQHRKVKNQRIDHLHKLTTRLAKTKSVIVLEDLDLSWLLKNRSFSKTVVDSGFGLFRKQLEYKTSWYGSRILFADRFYPSSKTCSSCGSKKKSLALSVRVFECLACGMILDRDVNAAVNLAKLGYVNPNTCSSQGSYDCGGTVQTPEGNFGVCGSSEAVGLKGPERDPLVRLGLGEERDTKPPVSLLVSGTSEKSVEVA